jgi:plastocyanin
MPRLIALLVLFAGAAHAEPLNGRIEDPSLRRKVDLVYVEKVEGTFPPPSTPPVINQKGNTYRPHLTVVLPGTKVIFQSQDPELHNVFARHASKAVLFNDAVLPGGKFERTFTKPGLTHLTCNVHREMSAYVMVLQNPYWTTAVDASGAFSIGGLQPGTYVLRVWGEKLSDEDNARTWQVTVGKGGEPARVASK